MKRLGIYIRVSSEQQAEEGDSLATQRSLGTAFAEANGLEPVIYEDAGISAFNDDISKRPSLTKLLVDVNSGDISAVWVQHQDRLARNIGVFSVIYTELRKADIELYFSGLREDFNSPSAKVQSNLLAVFAEYQSDLLSIKIKAVKTHNAKLGKANSNNLGYGYLIDDNGFIAIDKDVAENVKLIFKLRLDGYSFRVISDELEQRGIVKPTTYKKGDITNTKWSGASIKKMLSNTIYIGKPKYNDLDLYFEHLRLIDDDTFESVNSIKGAKRNKHQNSDFIFSSISYCKCGESLYNVNTKGKGDKSDTYYGYYRCSSHSHYLKHKCNNASVKADILHNEVLGVLLTNKDVFQSLESSLLGIDDTERSNLETQLKNLNDINTKLITKKDRLLELYLDSKLDKDIFDRKQREIDSEIADTQKSIKRLKSNLNTLTNPTKIIDSWSKMNSNLDSIIEGGNDAKREVILQYVDKIVYGRSNRNDDIKFNIYLKSGIVVNEMGKVRTPVVRFTPTRIETLSPEGKGFGIVIDTK